MTSRDEDDAWRAIVENYGERSVLDEKPAEPEPEPDPAPHLEPGDFVAPPEPVVEPEPFPVWDESEDARFVPPPIEPLPPLTPGRRAAWAALIASPLLLILAALTGWRPSGLIALLMAAGFVGGFVYLVATMPREPREPWDNGAQV